MLLAARFLSGIAVGVASSVGMASIVMIGGPARVRQASRLSSLGMVVGAGSGPLLAGGLSLAIEQPVIPIFGIEILILISAAAMVFAVPYNEAPTSKGFRWRLRLPHVPRANRRHLALGIALFGPGLAATSFMLSLGPSVLNLVAGTAGPLLAGGMACLMFFAAASVQFLGGSSTIRGLFFLSAIATSAAMAMIVAAIVLSSPLALCVAALLAGCGQGLGQLGGLTLLGLHVADSHRSQANALLSIGAYVPAGLMPLSAGFLVDWVGLAAGAMLFAAALSAAAIAGQLFVTRNVTGRDEG
jgi:MFS family permease